MTLNWHHILAFLYSETICGFYFVIEVIGHTQGSGFSSVYMYVIYVNCVLYIDSSLLVNTPLLALSMHTILLVKVLLQLHNFNTIFQFLDCAGQLCPVHVSGLLITIVSIPNVIKQNVDSGIYILHEVLLQVF